MPVRSFGEPDADRDADARPGIARVLRRADLVRLSDGTIRATQDEPGFGYGAPHVFGIRRCLCGRPAGEHDEELFAAVAEHASSSTDLGELRCHHAENLVSGIVAVRVVEALE